MNLLQLNALLTIRTFGHAPMWPTRVGHTLVNTVRVYILKQTHESAFLRPITVVTWTCYMTHCDDTQKVVKATTLTREVVKPCKLVCHCNGNQFCATRRVCWSSVKYRPQRVAHSYSIDCKSVSQETKCCTRNYTRSFDIWQN